MKKPMVLRGRGIIDGLAEGEALVVPTHIHTSGLDSKKGLIREVDHPQNGESIKGKVLVFNNVAGSSDWGATLHSVWRNGNGPIALVNQTAITLVLHGAISTRIPVVVDLDRDPLEVIETGDLVKVDADHGTVEVRKEKQGS